MSIFFISECSWEFIFIENKYFALIEICSNLFWYALLQTKRRQKTKKKKYGTLRNTIQNGRAQVRKKIQHTRKYPNFTLKWVDLKLIHIFWCVIHLRDTSVCPHMFKAFYTRRIVLFQLPSEDEFLLQKLREESR